MSFDRAWILVLALAPIAWSFSEWNRISRRSAMLLKAGAFMAIIAALAEPRIAFYDNKVAVAVLADTSRSLTRQDLERASSIATQIERERGRHWTEVIPFARTVRKPG